MIGRFTSMNVTSYYPVFYAEDLEAEAKRYTEDLGFTIKHKTEVKDLQYYILENNGNRIDLVHTTISHLPFSSGYYGIRVNVDNFEEGLTYFKNQGMTPEGEIRETDSARSVVLIGHDGSRIILFQHMKPGVIYF